MGKANECELAVLPLEAGETPPQYIEPEFMVKPVEGSTAKKLDSASTFSLHKLRLELVKVPDIPSSGLDMLSASTTCSKSASVMLIVSSTSFLKVAALFGQS